MGLCSAWTSRIRALFVGHNSEDRDFDEEVQTHLTLLVERFVRQGMTPEEALYAARRQFGNSVSLKEVRNEMSTFLSLEMLWRDLRYGVRQALSRPGVTAVITLSLALGIGANTAIFSLINAVMLKTLPAKNPEQLQLLTWTCGANRLPLASNAGYKYRDNVNGVLCSSLSYPFFEQLQSQANIFSSVFGFAPLSSGQPNLNIDVDGQTTVVAGEMVTGGYFSGLGIWPSVGRLIADEDEKVASPRVAVISYRFWVSEFGRNLATVGKAITVNGIPFTIVGVAPPDFFGVDSESSADIWIPADPMPGLTAWGMQPTARQSLFTAQDRLWLIIMGRLKPAVTHQQASAYLDGLFKQNLTANLNPTLKREELPRLALVSASRGLAALRQQLSEPLMMLLLIMFLVLMIACANVAILLLAQATARQREIGVRLALGASRLRLIRQLVTECVLLAGIGGALGLLFATWGIRVLLAVLASSGERVPNNVHPDPTVLGFTVLVSLLTGFLFGLVPAVRATGVTLTPLLKESAGRPLAGGPHVHLRFLNVLVVAQVAMSLFLLVAAGLFVATLRNVKGQDLGFNTRNLLLFSIDPVALDYDRLKLIRLYGQLHQRLQAIPGVRSATLSLSSLASGAVNTDEISIDRYRADRGQNLEVFWNSVGPKFFETMNIRRLTFDDSTIAGLDWTGDSQNVIYSSLLSGAPGLWMIPACGGKPRRLAVTGENAGSLSVSRTGNRLVYSRPVGDANIWRIRGSSFPDKINSPLKVIASKQQDHHPEISPDGKSIAFTSRRTGSDEIWVCDSDGHNAAQLTSFGGPEVGLPRWSPDGRKIAFNSSQAGYENIYVVGVGGGRHAA